jgi:hypothetical protein
VGVTPRDAFSIALALIASGQSEVRCQDSPATSRRAPPNRPILLAVDQQLGKVRGAPGAVTHHVKAVSAYQKAVSAYQGIVTLSRAHRVGSSPRACC